MSASRNNGRDIAFDQTLNRIVRYQIADTPAKAEQLVAGLPFIVSTGLDAELAVCKEAHRYDLVAKRAYYLRLEGTRLHSWSWSEVDNYVEAGNLLSLVAALENEISEELANEVYLRATGRNVNQPLKVRGDDPRDET
jgi:hypothetical protein